MDITTHARLPHGTDPSLPMTERISMVLIDDDALAREGVLSLIRGQPGFVVLAAAAGADDALRLIRARQPNVVLVNLRGTEGDALTLTGALHGDVPGSRTMLMGLVAGVTDVSSFIRAGVSGFVMGQATLPTFLDTVRAVARGERVLPPELTAALFAQLISWRTPPEPARRVRRPRLTRREQDVCDLVVQGLANKTIATRLRISAHTVKSHVHRILAKLSADSRLEVAMLSRRGGPRSPARPQPPPGEGPARYLSSLRRSDLVIDAIPGA